MTYIYVKKKKEKKIFHLDFFFFKNRQLNTYTNMNIMS